MSKIENLSDMLQDARKKGYAVGSFSARYTKLKIGRASCRERV